MVRLVAAAADHQPRVRVADHDRRERLQERIEPLETVVPSDKQRHHVAIRQTVSLAKGLASHRGIRQRFCVIQPIVDDRNPLTRYAVILDKMLGRHAAGGDHVRRTGTTAKGLVVDEPEHPLLDAEELAQLPEGPDRWRAETPMAVLQGRRLWSAYGEIGVLMPDLREAEHEIDRQLPKHFFRGRGEAIRSQRSEPRPLPQRDRVDLDLRRQFVGIDLSGDDVDLVARRGQGARQAAGVLLRAAAPGTDHLDIQRDSQGPNPSLRSMRACLAKTARTSRLSWDGAF